VGTGKLNCLGDATWSERPVGWKGPKTWRHLSRPLMLGNKKVEVGVGIFRRVCVCHICVDERGYLS
jgi:hypothetical protein